MNRRALLRRTVGVAASVLAPLGAGARRALAQAARKLPVGTPYPLVALPTKAPLGQVYDLPPNYETPTPHLIGTQNYPFTDTEYYYVRYREPFPAVIAQEDLALTVTGDAIEKPLTLTMADLKGFPTVELGAVGECSGLGRGLLRPMIPGLPWTKGDVSCAVWTGASLKAVLEEAGIKETAVQIAFKSGAPTLSKEKPEYWRAYLPETVLHPDAMLAYKMNGGNLNFWNGAPLRLVIPGTYAPSWVKQVVEIEVRTTPQPMEWSGRPIGKGTLKTYSLITDPPDGTEVPVGSTARMRGIAWDGGQGIAKVEVSLDGGASWQPATLDKSYGSYVWRVFTFSLPVTKPGEIRILSRATSVDGATQPMEPEQAVLANGGRQNNASGTFAAYLMGVAS